MVKVATIINTHGLKGECKLYLFTDDVQDRFKKGRKLYIDENNYLTVQSFRMQKGFPFLPILFKRNLTIRFTYLFFKLSYYTTKKKVVSRFFP